MAANIAKAGYSILVHDADTSRVTLFVKEYSSNAKAASSGGGDSFKDVDVLITMLPNGKVVREVLLGENGIAKTLKAGTVVVDTSSSSPFDTRQLGADLLAHGISLIDAPVTQIYLHAIDTGGATLMLGSDSKDAVEIALPVLEAMSKYTFVMGALGAGHAMKTLNNYVSVGSIIALCDALVVGQKFGLDPKTMIDVMNVGTARNFSTAYAFRTEALTRRYESGYQLALLIKDMKITKDLVDSVGFESQLPGLSIEYLEDALSRVAPDANHEQCLKAWEQRAGIELKTSEQPKDKVVADPEVMAL